MAPFVVAGVVIVAKAALVALPRKALFIGGSAHELRLSAADLAQDSLESMRKKEWIPPEQAAAALEDIKRLRRVSFAGWSSGEELKRVGRVLWALIPPLPPSVPPAEA